MLCTLLDPWKSCLFLFLTGSILWVANGNAVMAQEDEILNRLYGNGVHAYKRGDYIQAHRWLSEAIDSGNRDPRTRYFRGLAYLKLQMEKNHMTFTGSHYFEKSKCLYLKPSNSITLRQAVFALLGPLQNLLMNSPEK